MEETDKMICSKCNKDCEETYMFGAYGNNPVKIKDELQYCKICFDIKDKLHDKAHGLSLEKTPEEDI